MIKTTRKLAAAVALLAMGQSQVAMAQECIEQQDLSDAVVYAMPLLTDAFMSKCDGELAADGFMLTQGEEFAAPYRAQQDRNWPAASRLLAKFAAGDDEAQGNNEMAAMLGSLPEEAVRPFVDAIIVQKVSEEIKLADCGKIERGVALLAPLPPENTGGLAAFLFDMAGVKNPSMCPYRPE